MYYINLYLFSGEFDKRIAKCLNRTVDITFNNDIKLLEISDGDTSSYFIKSYMFLSTKSLFSL